MIAFIPARGNSKRIPNKNVKLFFGHPLIAYAIQSAIDSEIFSQIYVSSDSEGVLKIAQSFGIGMIERPKELAGDLSTDQEWIDHAFTIVEPDKFAILRPTNPFRTAETIKRAVKSWDPHCILKAVELVKQHPAKMWDIIGEFMFPNYLGGDHYKPYQSLYPVYVQNGCIELRPFNWKTKVIFQPFLTQGYEGFDLNTEEDWLLAEILANKIFDSENEFYETTL